MHNFLRKVMLAGAGLAFITTEKIEKVFNELVKKGEAPEKEARETVTDLKGRIEKIRTSILKRLKVPTKVELEEIRERLERLERPGEHKE